MSHEQGRILRIVLLTGALAWSAPAFAQNDFSGEWAPVRNQDSSENPLVGDWIGIPLNEAGLARSEAWDASIQSLPEWQCRPHGWAYIYRGPTALRIWRDIDPLHARRHRVSCAVAAGGGDAHLS